MRFGDNPPLGMSPAPMPPSGLRDYFAALFGHWRVVSRRWWLKVRLRCPECGERTFKATLEDEYSALTGLSKRGRTCMRRCTFVVAGIQKSKV